MPVRIFRTSADARAEVPTSTGNSPELIRTLAADARAEVPTCYSAIGSSTRVMPWMMPFDASTSVSDGMIRASRMAGAASTI